MQSDTVCWSDFAANHRLHCQTDGMSCHHHDASRYASQGGEHRDDFVSSKSSCIKTKTNLCNRVHSPKPGNLASETFPNKDSAGYTITEALVARYGQSQYSEFLRCRTISDSSVAYLIPFQRLPRERKERSHPAKVHLRKRPLPLDASSSILPMLPRNHHPYRHQMRLWMP